MHSTHTTLCIPVYVLARSRPLTVAPPTGNSVREEGLLMIARGGAIYSPGSMGTFQEVFQDACQNHYLTAGVISPMIFIGKEFWTKKKPVYPLLCDLAAGQPYAKYMMVTDSTEEVIEALVRYDTEVAQKPQPKAH